MSITIDNYYDLLAATVAAAVIGRLLYTLVPTLWQILMTKAFGKEMKLTPVTVRYEDNNGNVKEFKVRKSKDIRELDCCPGTYMLKKNIIGQDGNLIVKH